MGLTSLFTSTPRHMSETVPQWKTVTSGHMNANFGSEMKVWKAPRRAQNRRSLDQDNKQTVADHRGATMEIDKPRYQLVSILDQDLELNEADTEVDYKKWCRRIFDHQAVDMKRENKISFVLPNQKPAARDAGHRVMCGDPRMTFDNSCRSDCIPERRDLLMHQSYQLLPRVICYKRSMNTSMITR
jgi:hypothetical protein